MRSRLFATFVCLSCLSLAAAGPARAETHRLAVVVGNNAGGPTDKPLRWAEEDASKVADVLVQLGDVTGDDLQLLRGHGQADLRAALERAGRRVAEHRQNPADRTVLLFYYSGHSDAEALELGGDRVTWAELRAWLAATRADVRVAVVDGCKSGALVQRKGGTRGPAFEIKLNDQIDAAGEALLTSSAADELALESAEIRGSIFTHHLVSGLRGAADASGDGRVTLSEAYQYAFDHTLAASASTGVRQHPGYDYRLSGKGELVLTEVTSPSASLELPEGFERALVLLVRRDQVLAELQAGGTRRVAMGPGEYAVRLWRGTQAWAGRVTLAAGEARKVAWADLTRLDVPRVAEKGGPGSRPAPELEGLTPEAQVEFLQKYFSVGDEDALSPTYQNTSLDSRPTIYQGKYHQEITQPDFFRQVGRDDLAQEYARRRTRKVMFIGGGIAVGVAGLVAGLSGSCSVNNAQTCIANKQTILALSAVAGAGIATIGILVKTSPAGPEEIRRLADQYNEGLRRRLATPPPATEASAPEIEVQPLLLRGGAGVAIGLRF
jgi:hypothetical protein